MEARCQAEPDAAGGLAERDGLRLRLGGGGGVAGARDGALALRPCGGSGPSRPASGPALRGGRRRPARPGVPALSPAARVAAGWRDRGVPSRCPGVERGPRWAGSGSAVVGRRHPGTDGRRGLVARGARAGLSPRSVLAVPALLPDGLGARRRGGATARRPRPARGAAPDGGDFLGGARTALPAVAGRGSPVAGSRRRLETGPAGRRARAVVAPRLDRPPGADHRLRRLHPGHLSSPLPPSSVAGALAASQAAGGRRRPSGPAARDLPPQHRWSTLPRSPLWVIGRVNGIFSYQGQPISWGNSVPALQSPQTLWKSLWESR